MGITGLLPFLEKGNVSRPANIKEFAGCTAAADAYCWLHKGAFSCADKLARGEETDMYVQYCMKFVNMLLAHNIKPILVFDGRHLPAKAATEKKRRQKREENRKQAASLLRQGHSNEALSFLRRCVDVTHKMALRLMQECRNRNIDCIVAPYEADAQLAFFSLEGIADLVITEDSDLLLFGCKKVMFKLDLVGNGVLVDQSRLHQSMASRPEVYSFDKFRHMCILSGCDYLESLPGIGLGKACKFITRTQDPDIHKALSRLPSQLNIRGLTVSFQYRDEFLKADAMFRHQLVFDPITRKTQPLTPFQKVHPSSPLANGPLPGCEPEFDDDTCYQLALGNLDPFKLEKVDNYDPDVKTPSLTNKTSSWNQKAVAPHPSIWNIHYKDSIAKVKPQVAPSFMVSESRPLLKEKVRTIDTTELLVKNTKKRSLDTEKDLQVAKKLCQDSQESTLTSLYSNNLPATVSPTNSPTGSPKKSIVEISDSVTTSPLLSGNRFLRNPFACSPPTDSCAPSTKAVEINSNNDLNVASHSSPSTPSVGKFGALSKFARATQRTSTEGKPIVQSRYFFSDQHEPKAEPDQIERSSNSLRDLSNTTFNEDTVKEQPLHMGYGQNISPIKKSPKIHKKPLFASSSNISSLQNFLLDSGKDVKDRNTVGSSVDLLKTTLHEKSSGQGSLPKSTPPSQNPWKKKTAPTEECEDVENSDSHVLYESSPRLHKISFSTPDDEAVDDPGFEISPSPSTPTNQVCSQPDEGFESPSKSESTFVSPPAMKQIRTPQSAKLKKPACRISGLRKPSSSPGQSKLSAFGFLTKPKIQKT